MPGLFEDTDIDELQDDPGLLASLRLSQPQGVMAPNPVPQGAPPQAEEAPSAPEPDEEKQDFNPSKYLVTQDDLQAAQAKKANLAMMGALTQNLANRQSVGNFATGRMAPKQDLSDYTKSMEDVADQPVQQKQQLMKQEMEKPSLQYMQQAVDPNSELSKMSAQVHASQLQLVRGAFAAKNPQLAAMVDSVIAKLPSMSQYQQTQLLDKTGLSKLLSSEAVSGQKNDMTRMMMEQRREQMQDRMDTANHQKMLGRLSNDKQLGQRLVQYQNLDNAMSNFTNAEHPTVPQFNELQQAVRANLGIKGNSGVGEREETYIRGLGLNWAAWKQFITMEPQDVAKNNGLLLHIQQLARMEQANIGKQYGSRLNAVTSGNGSMYARRPDLKADLEAAIDANRGQFGSSQGGDGQTETASTTQPPPAGGGGLIPSAQAAPVPKRKVSQDEINAYAQKYGMNPNAAATWLRSQGHATD